MNRPTNAERDVVGLFLEPLPVRARVDNDTGDATSLELLHQVRESSQSALVSFMPWFDSVVTFHDDQPDSRKKMGKEKEEEILAIDGFISEPVCAQEGAKFSLLLQCHALRDGRLVLRVEHDTDYFFPPCSPS
ncbi:hypothetical protein BBP40_009443, partial [Aspergillus hancockii]